MKRSAKLSVCVFIFFFSLIIPRVSAQTAFTSLLDTDKTISLDLQEASLKDVLKIFSIQSGLNFISSEAVKDRKITVYLDNVPIKDAMVKLFKANKLVYDFDEEANIFTVNYADDIGEPEMITKIFTLRYRSVASANLEREKTNLFASGNSVTSGSFSSGAGTASVAPVQGANLLETIRQVVSKNGKVVEDAKTNSLIVTDVASRFPVINEIIAKLDAPQPQVMLEVEMLDVSKNSVDKLGFNVGTPDNPNPMTMVIGPGSDLFFGTLLTRNGVPQGSVKIGNTYSLVLDLLKQQKDTKFLARPRILTLNNETAEIGITRDEVVSKTTRKEYLTESAPPTETTEYERATSLTLTPEGIGVFLRVTPQINMETGEVTLVINPKTSSTSQSPYVNSRTDIALDPEVRSTKSIIKVKDGETVVMGGLIHQEKEVTKQKVPILGDVPIIGAMFRHKDVAKDVDRELLVFITPHIIREPNVGYTQGNKAVGQYPQAPSDRRQAVANMLNTFERERNANGQRKVSQAGGAFN